MIEPKVTVVSSTSQIHRQTKAKVSHGRYTGTMASLSPFPGMDPYLEMSWGDVHTQLITGTQTLLNLALPQDLVARVEEEIAVESDADDPDRPMARRRLGPDARVFETIEEFGAQAGSTTSAGAIALAPFRLALLDEPITERHIRIIDLHGGERVVTVIEFISPANKTISGANLFVRKRDALLDGGVNVVEVDLVRAGALLGPYVCPAEAIATFRAVMRLPGGDVFLHPMSLRAPLPSIRIPLRLNEQPAELSLQLLIEQAYENGRYARTIDYRKPCEPALEDDDAAWADNLLKAVGRR